MLVLALIASFASADVDAGPATPLSISPPASSILVSPDGRARVSISRDECDDAGDVGREFAFDGQSYVCARNSGGFFWLRVVPPAPAAASAPPPSSPLPPELIWMITLTVLAFGLTAGGAWLHSTANRTRATNPAAAAAMDSLGDALATLKKAVDAGVPTPAIGDFVDGAAESFFHAHTVVTGAPHADDPRAPPTVKAA